MKTRAILAAGLSVGLVVTLAGLERRLFEDAEISPLYARTLEDAYSRFARSDAVVLAGAPRDAAAAPTATESRSLGAAAGAASSAAAYQAAYEAAVRESLEDRAAALTEGKAPADDATVRKLASALRRVRPPVAGAGVGSRAGTANPEQEGHDPAQGHDHASGEEHDHSVGAFANGEALLQAGRYGEALAMFESALEQDGPCAPVLHRIGDIQQQLDRLDAAVATYERLADHSPDQVCALVHVVDIWRVRGEQGRLEEVLGRAERAFRAQLDTDRGGEQGLRRTFARFLLRERRSLSEAVSIAEELCERPEPDVDDVVLLAQCYGAAERWDEADAALDRAVALDPEREAEHEDLRRSLIGEGS